MNEMADIFFSFKFAENANMKRKLFVYSNKVSFLSHTLFFDPFVVTNKARK